MSDMVADSFTVFDLKTRKRVKPLRDALIPRR